MEAAQEQVAYLTLKTLKALRAALPRKKEYKQLHMILNHDIKAVSEEHASLKAGKSRYFTNVIALSHMMTAIAICQAHDTANN